MSTKNNNQKKNSLFNSKNMIVLGIATATIALFAIIMTALMPTEDAKESAFENRAEESAMAREKVTSSDNGLNSVYNEEAIATAKTQEEEKSHEETQKEQEEKAEKDGNKANGQAEQNITNLIDFPVVGAVLKDYSGDNLVYSETMNDWRTHNGIDFSAEEGTDVLAVADGTVEDITDNGMLGRTIIVVHNGGFRSVYSNLAEGTEVAVGDNVLKGTPIGRVGSTATEEAMERPHLHFEVSLNNEIVNPYDYLPEVQNDNE